MKKILWTPILLIPLVGGLLIAIGFYNVEGGPETEFFFTGGILLITIGVMFYSSEKTKRLGDGKLIVRKRRNEN